VPFTVPTVPGSLQAVGGNGSVRLTWTAPTSNGGAAIVDYVVQVGYAGVWTTVNDGVRATTGYTVSGLKNGSTYYFHVRAINAAGPGAYTTSAKAVPVRPPTVYLTFDDGPSAYTLQVLALLKRFGALATFFVVGQEVSASPQLVAQTAAAGHVIANHTWSHPDLTGLSDDRIRSELLRTEQAVRAITSAATTLYRPPYGSTSSRVRSIAAALGMREVLWTIDTRDWSRPGAGTIAYRVLSDVRDGSIVLFHDGGGNRSQTVEALQTVLPELLRRGFQTSVIPD
jgi:peptidoglycan/xylan/chitin deacetylase (PgdA/CDA1 family)